MAQSTPGNNRIHQHLTQATQVEYVCPVCFSTSKTEGDCKKDGTPLIKMGDYFCPKCGMEFSKAGKCDMDGSKLIHMTPAYIKEQLAKKHT